MSGATSTLGHPRESAADYPTPPSYERVEQHVRVTVDGIVVAETSRPVVARQTGLAPVWYVPRTDVREDALVPVDGSTHCPFKGDATYYAVAVGARTIPNAAWSYLEPLSEAASIAEHVAFYAQAVEATVDGERVHAPDWEWAGGWLLPWTVGPHRSRETGTEARASVNGGAVRAPITSERETEHGNDQS